MRQTRRKRNDLVTKESVLLKWYATPPIGINPGPQIQISNEYIQYRESAMLVDPPLDFQPNGTTQQQQPQQHPDVLVQALVAQLLS